MTFEEYLQRILDTKTPRSTLAKAPHLGPGRGALFEQMVEEFLPRDMDDEFSEARVAKDFTPAQLGYLEMLSAHDFSRILDSDRLFTDIGVPKGLGARRVWLGFDPSISLSRAWSVEHKGKKRSGTLWQAIYVAYWWEQKPKVVKELLSELPPEELFDFFYRWDEMTFDRKDPFCEAITEHGREFLAKYAKEPTKGLLAWAERRAEEVRSGSEPEPETRDTWAVLAVLASRLPKKGSFGPEHEALFFSGRRTVPDGAAGTSVWLTAPEEWRLRFLETKLRPLLSKEMPAPLEAQWFFELRYLPFRSMKLSEAELTVIYRAVVRAWELDSAMLTWGVGPELKNLGLKQIPAIDVKSASERKARAWIAKGCVPGPIAKVQESSSYTLVEPASMGALSAVERAQLRAVGRSYFDKDGTEDEVMRWGLEQSIMFGFVKLQNRRGQRVGDGWFGFSGGQRFVGYLFEPDATERIPNVLLGGGDFVGWTRADHIRAQQAGLKARTRSWVEDRTAAARKALGL